MSFLLYIFLEGLMRVMGLRVHSKRMGAGDLILDMGISSLGIEVKEKRKRECEFGKCEFGKCEFGKCTWLNNIGARCVDLSRPP
jgi:hypothetical protein